jgi:hypothetical protein
MKRIIFFVLLLPLSSSFIDLPAMGHSEKVPEIELLKLGEEVEITGRIKIKGNEPLSYIVVVSDEKDYILKGDLAVEIRNKYLLNTLFIKGRVLFLGATERPAEIEVLSYRVLKK